MEISTSTIAQLQGAALQKLEGNLEGLRPGQLLNALVTAVKGQQLQLQIGQRLLSAQSELPLQTGQQVKVLVESLGEKPLLKLLAADTAKRGLELAARQFGRQAPAKGDLIRATVVESRADGRTLLRVGNQTFQAQSHEALRPGQQLKLLVASAGKTLHLLPKGAEEAQQINRQATSRALPQQRPMTELLANLGAIRDSRGPGQGLPPLPKGIDTLARLVLQSLPRLKDLTRADGLRRAIRQSGFQLEQQLQSASGEQTARLLQHDFKALLMQLRSRLHQAMQQQASQTGQAARPQPGVAPGNGADTRPSAPPTPTNRPAATPAAPQAAPTRPTAPPGPLPKPATPSNTTAGTTTARPARPAVAGQRPAVAPLPPLPPGGTTTGTSPAPRRPGGGSEGNMPSLPRQDNAPPPLPGSQPRAQGRAAATLPSLSNMMEGMGELLRQTEGALARLQLHQLSSLNEQEGPKQAWSLELPLRDEENSELLHLRIEKDGGSDNENDPRAPINVTLALDLENLGPIYARLNLVRDTVSVAFWAEREETVTQARQALESLQEGLRDAGLVAENLNVHQGQPPNLAAFRQSDRILDVQA